MTAYTDIDFIGRDTIQYYIFRYLTDKLLPIEVAADRLWTIRFKYPDFSVERQLKLANHFTTGIHLITDEVITLAGSDLTQFRISVSKRILSDNPNIFINRCPRCKRVLATNIAKQCFSCGFDWHDYA